MRDVFDFAKFFIKNGADSMPNTYDGNMKLQKLLVLADLVNFAEYGELQFDEQVPALKNGCIVSEKGYEVLKLVTDIFGGASEKELSSIVDMMSQHADVERMREIISVHRETASDTATCEIINGVTFYYDGFALTDDMIERLENFSLSVEDDTYSLYLDDGRLVIY